MEYFNIRKYLGDDWLKRQLEEIENINYVKGEISKDQIVNDIAFPFLGKIDEILIKFENIENFSEWIKEAKTSKSFEDCLFELMALENLLLKTDKLILKPVNNISKLVPEALIEKNNKELFIEMTKLKDIKGSYKNKVEKLFGKARNKFKGSQGIHFIGIFDLFNYIGENEFPLRGFHELKNTIQMRFNFRENKSIQAFVLTNIFLVYNPQLKRTFVQKRYYLLNKPEDKGGFPTSFFDSIFDVDRFIEK